MKAKNKAAIGTPNAKLLLAKSSSCTNGRLPRLPKYFSYQMKSRRAGTLRRRRRCSRAASRVRGLRAAVRQQQQRRVTWATPPWPTASRFASFGRMKSAATMVIMASGTLTGKIGRHSRPHNVRQQRAAENLPAIAAMPMTEPKMPSAWARSLPANVNWMMARTCGYISAPPMPWMAWAAIRMLLDGAASGRGGGEDQQPQDEQKTCGRNCRRAGRR